MDNEAGEGFRDAFQELLEEFGENFHVAGETKRGVFSEQKGTTKISFSPGEFSLKHGDVIIHWATEEKYAVLSAKSCTIAGVAVNFEATVVPRS